LVRFEEQDIGVAPETTESLFSSFKTDDNTMTKKYNSTGLTITNDWSQAPEYLL